MRINLSSALLSIILLFGSCAERFTTRGEGRPAFYIPNPPHARSAEKRWAVKSKQALHRDTLHTHHNTGALPVEFIQSYSARDWAIDSNLKSTTTVYKGQDISEKKASPKKEIGKQKLPKKSQKQSFLELIQKWGKNLKGDRLGSNSEHFFLERPYLGDSIGYWILYLNVILALIPTGLLLIGSFIDSDFFYILLVWLIPLGITLYQYFKKEYLYEEGGLFRFSFWLIAGSIFAQFITAPIAIIQMFTSFNGSPPSWTGIILGLLVLGLLLHIISYIAKLLNYIFGDMHWALIFLYSLLLLLILFILTILLIVIIFPPF